MIKLSPREREVLTLFVQTGCLTLVAEALGSSVHTVRTQKNSVIRNLGATSVGLVRAALQKGLIRL
jgi:DNA-binding NarL/FixJ family response regulator